MSNALALSAQGLTKAYRKRRVVDDVSFAVKQGEIVGFLGPNGAGKTTVMNIVMGLTPADEGSVSLFGQGGVRTSRDLRSRIGFLQEKPFVYPDMSATGYLSFFADLYNVASPQRRVGEVLERVGLGASAHRPLGTFSRGMQQRTCLARVMLHRPEFLILDEPTLGLDPDGVAQMREIFREMREEGTTLLFSSHQLAEIERICDSVIFMLSGKIIASGRQEELLPAAATDQGLVVELFEPTANLLAAARALPHVIAVRPLADHRMVVTLDSAVSRHVAERRAFLSRSLTGLGATVLSIVSAVPSLEDVFLALTSQRTNPAPSLSQSPTGGAKWN